MIQRRTPLKRTPLKRKQKVVLTIGDLMASGNVFKASKVPKKRKPIRKKAKNNPGWWDVALEIWATRPHICEVCRRKLGDEPIPIYFSHLLPRGSYRKYKRDPRNIVLKCRDHHDTWHSRGPTWLSDHEGWTLICNTYFMLRDEANGITQ
jgi:hypothetical protein